MMKLSRTVTYGLQATLQLAKETSQKPVSSRQLAEDGQMPERFLLQILRNLVAHGILESTRGVDGGYSLERTPDQISLLEVIEAVEGPLTSTLPLGEGLSSVSKSRLEDALAEVTELARRQLQAVKLAHLLPAPRKSRRQTG